MPARSAPPAPTAASLARLRAGFQRDFDEERRRLARSLHDSALQTLTAASMNLSLVDREAALSASGRQALADAQALVDACARELRTLSHALFPALLASAGLEPALRWLGRQHGGERLRLEVSPLPRFGLSVELAAFRVVEEAVVSVYAEGAPIALRAVAQTEDVLDVTIQGRTRGDGAAEAILRQRVRAVGGRLRTRLVGDELRVDVRFPPSAPDDAP